MIDRVIIVPYRDRHQHLDRFISYMQGYIPDLHICIVEQSADGKPFNRGKLLNIGALNCPARYYIMHDVDMLPVDCKYEASPYAEVVQFASSKIQLKDYLGGVTMFTHPVFWKVGGYHNDYFHRAEDNELRFNLKRMRIPVLEDHCQFTQLPHARSNDFIAALWQKAQQKRSEQNQLAHCAYKIIESVAGDKITRFKVDLLAS